MKHGSGSGRGFLFVLVCLVASAFLLGGFMPVRAQAGVLSTETKGFAARVAKVKSQVVPTLGGKGSVEGQSGSGDGVGKENFSGGGKFSGVGRSGGRSGVFQGQIQSIAGEGAGGSGEGVVLRPPVVEEEVDETREELDSKYGGPVLARGRELVYRRDARHFVTYIGSKVLTYQDRQGRDRVVDLDLVKQGDGFVPKSGPVEVRLPETVGKHDPIVVGFAGRELKIAPEKGVYGNSVVLDNAIRYNGVSDGVDAQYRVSDNGVKEDIILREFRGEHVFSYSFLRAGLKARLELNQVVVADEKTGKELFVLSAPVMVDAAGAESQNIRLSLEKKSDRFLLHLDADRFWLEDKRRVYPVKIDPSVVVPSESLIEVTTCTTYGSYSGRGYGYVGYVNNEVMGVYGVPVLGSTRMYFKINYDFRNGIPAEARIDSAYLNVYQYGQRASSQGNNFESYMIYDSWDAGSLTWDSSVGMRAKISGAKAVLPYRYGGYSFDIRTAVNEWFTGIAPNYGVYIKAGYEGQTGGIFYTPYSTGSAGQGDFSPDKRPNVVVNWSVPDPVDVNYPVDSTTVGLYPMGISEISGKLAFQGVIGSGVARPGAKVEYSLNDKKKNYQGVVDASYSYKYPNSSSFESAFPKGTSKWREKQGNWQTRVPFVNPEFNVKYALEAKASRGGVTGKSATSDSFVIYQVKQFDTLPKIANYYGVPLAQIAYDNHIQDMLLLKNNVLFIRNPNKNALIPYNPPALDDSVKARVDSLLMGRGLHCEFGFEPVNLNTGNFFFEHTDVSINDYVEEFKIERAYNSKNRTNGVFGWGWSFVYDEQITKGDGDSFLYKRGDGSVIPFIKQGKRYIAPAGYDLELRVEKVKTKTGVFSTGKKTYPVYQYVVEDKDGGRKVFNFHGLLTEVSDREGNRTKIDYDKNFNLRKLTSPSGIIYNISTGEDGRIEKIVLPNGGELKYGYNEKGDLSSYTDAVGNVTRYVYDQAHRMVSWSDGEGRKIITNRYDESGRVLKQVDANGRVSRLVYGDKSTTTIDGDGKQVKYFYDDQYRTLRVEDGLGVRESKTYTEDNRVKSSTDALGRVKTFTYDSRGNVTGESGVSGKISRTFNQSNQVERLLDPAGNETRFVYSKGHLQKVYYNGRLRESVLSDKYGRITQRTDEKGVKTSFTYTGPVLSEVVDGGGALTRFSYDGLGKVVQVVNGQGQVAKYSYDLSGRVLSQVDADGVKTSYTYDKSGNVLTVKDGNGNVKSFTYDGMGNRIVAGNGSGGTYQNVYDVDGHLLKVVDPEGRVSNYVYDARGRLVLEMNGKGDTLKYTYDALGRRLSEISENGAVTSYSYDDVTGQIASVTDALGNTIRYSYDANGLVEGIVYPDGVKETFTYGKYQELLSHTDRGGVETKYYYDQVGKLILENRAGQIKGYEYDKAGRVVARAFPGGGKITQGYDQLGHLAWQKDAAGRVTKFKYSSMGRLLSRVDAVGNSVVYGYDGNGNQVQVRDGAGGVVRVEYNGQNNPGRVVDGLGGVSRFKYNQMEQVSEVIDAEGGVVSYEYDLAGLPVKVKDAGGGVYSFSYTGSGRVEKVVAPDGTSVCYGYDLLDRVVGEVYSSGYERYYAYDEMSRVVREWDNQREDRFYRYDGVGRLVEESNQVGEVTGYVYDELGRLVKQVFPDGRSSSYVYDRAGNLVKETDREGKTISYEHDINGNIVSRRDSQGRKWFYEYDELNQLVSERNPLGEETRYVYDVNGNRVKTVYPGGVEESQGFDRGGNLVYSTDGNGNTTLYTYDGLNRLVEQARPDGSKTSYTYDANGNLSEQVDPLGAKTLREYDPMGRLVAQVSPNGGRTTYAYDEYGFLAKESSPVGAVTRYVNNVYGQVLRKENPEGGVSKYDYDKLGRVVKASLPEGLSKSFVYDKSSNLTAEIDQSGRKASYRYDLGGRVTSRVNSLGQEDKFVYDTAGRLAKSITPAGRQTSYSYDELDRLIEKTSPAGRKTSYSYDERGRLVEEKVNARRGHVYEYDKNGNLIGQSDPLGGKSVYTYDGVDRLVKQVDPLGAVTEYRYDRAGRLNQVDMAGAESVRYSYDANGNLTERVEGQTRSSHYSYDLGDRLVKASTGEGNDTREVKYDYDREDRLVEKTNARGAKTTFTYDKLGRTTTQTDPLGGKKSFIYDANGNLAKLVKPSGKTITYKYNELDDLVKVDYQDKTLGQVLYAYDVDGRRVLMNDKTGQTSYTYDKDGLITGVKQGDGSIIKYEYDSYGNVSALIYPDGSKVEYVYDELDRLIQVKDTRNRQTVNYDYDKASNLIRVKRSDGTSSRIDYDPTGKITHLENLSRTGKIISAYTYTYDHAGLILTETVTTSYDGEWETTYTYNTAGELTSETTITNPHRGPPTNTNNTNSAVSASHNEIESALIRAKTRKTLPKPGSEVTHIEYGYDQAGNRITTKTSSSNAGNNAENEVKQVEYSYDLTDALVSDSEGTKYVYDQDGNRVRKLADGERIDYHYDSQDRLIAVKNQKGLLFAALYDGDSNRVFTANRTTRKTGYRLFKSPQTSVLGDGISLFWKGLTTSLVQGFNVSNSTTGKIWENTWDEIETAYHMHLAKQKASREGIVIEPETLDKPLNWDNLKYASEASQVFIPYANKQDTDTYYEIRNYINDINQANTQVLAAYDESGKTVEKYTYGKQRLNYTSPGATLNYLYDGRGSVRALTDHNGQVKDSYSYTGYGNSERGSPKPTNPNTTSATAGNTTGNPYQYNGEYVDPATGLQYLRARYYDLSTPKANTFLTKDTYPGTLDNPHSQNPYLYANADPINHIDPTGHWGWGIWDKIKSGVKRVYNAGKSLVRKGVQLVKRAYNAVSHYAYNAYQGVKHALSHTYNYVCNTSNRYLGRVINVASQTIEAVQATAKSAYERALETGKAAHNWGASKLAYAKDMMNSWTETLDKTFHHFCTTAKRWANQTVEFVKNADWKTIGIAVAATAVAVGATVITGGLAGPAIAAVTTSVLGTGAVATGVTAVATGAVIGAVGAGTYTFTESILEGKGVSQSLKDAGNSAVKGGLVGGLTGGGGTIVKQIANALPGGKQLIQKTGEYLTEAISDVVVNGTDLTTSIVGNITGKPLKAIAGGSSHRGPPPSNITKPHTTTTLTRNTASHRHPGAESSGARPSYRQSEIDTANDYPNYRTQVSFKDNDETYHGKKGSTRPDLYGDKQKHAIEVKNYDLENPKSRTNLKTVVKKQYEQREKHLPKGAKQTLVIDVRGQNVSKEVLEDLERDLLEKTGNGMEIRYKGYKD